MKIGFIGQGWIGKNYADDFEKRGYEVIRYALETEYKNNREKIAACDITFIAVPTPTTTKGFDSSILESVLPTIGKGKVAVIKSTILPGTTQKLQAKFTDIVIMHSPEFLTEVTAAFDAAHPNRNIIGIVNEKDRELAQKVMTILPAAPYKAVVDARTAEIIKYGNNTWFYVKVLWMNMVYDLCQNLDIDYNTVKEAMSYDPRIGFTHLDVVHKGGRGAGGHCFIKDFAAFAQLYREKVGQDQNGKNLLNALEEKNIELLVKSNKNLDLLEETYGEDKLK
jgi:UDPglucose 6-dehydrogenase